ncbi:hypothetical protein PHJA_002716700 [Phtheirospermum japonicum]|uniref:Uncharacterized protein n=1 Tax=Phtheirospermum japonicum TaxID=374723 RepID=A0A830DFV1_9LAMI|nr:hypothetical protein PHJA_002716700 [Phtheirospermum japonicum]
METSVISDAISSIAHSTQSLGFSNFLNRSNNILSLSDTLSDQPSRSPTPFHISAASPPPTRTLTKRRLRKTRRVRRRVVIDYDGEEDGIFVFSDGGGFNSGDGYFGSGGGGRGWNFGGYGGANWEEFSENSISDPAFDFVYEVLCWIAMSNCLHFAFKKVARFVGDRGKVPMRLTPVC